MSVLPLVRKHPIWAVIAAVFAAVLAGWWLNPWHADAAGETESVLTPITPCRAVDTREAIGIDRTTKLGASESVDVTFAGGVGNCVLPDNITAVSANIFAVAPTATSPVSFFTVGPSDQELSTTSVLNFNNQLAVFGNEVRIPLSADGAATIFNAFGDVHLIADINGYYTPTTGGAGGAELAALQDRVAELEALLADVSRQPDINGYDTITFTGVNLQLVDGTGDTYGTPSGLGNLIIGYNPQLAGIPPEQRAGAHNLVIGDEHIYGTNGAGGHAAGGIVAGRNNTISELAATVTGGRNNAATALGASVTGGRFNSATGAQASVTGGYNNTATGAQASVTGGVESSATGTQASVTGGFNNTADGNAASVTGGQNNTADGYTSAATGGGNNTVDGAGASITSGYGNETLAHFSAVTGGESNRVETLAEYASISGGQSNTAAGDHSSVSGGENNEAAGASSTVLGGLSNTADGAAATTVGGGGSNAAGDLSVSLAGNGVGGVETCAALNVCSIAITAY